MTTERFSRVHQLIDEHNIRFKEHVIDVVSAKFFERFAVSGVNGRLHIDFYASPFDEAFKELLIVLRDGEIASQVQALTFHAPDEGANGTREWDFSPLLNSDVTFPNLIWLSIEHYDGIYHNHPIVGSDYDENGQLAKWLAKSPSLKFLQSPSAPNAEFFKVEHQSLELLHIQAGYESHNFIMNFSQANGFPSLWRLDYTDYNERYMDDYPQRCTPLEHFRELFKSKAFSTVTSFIWHDPVYSIEQLRQIRMVLRPEVCFRVTQFAADDIHMPKL